MALTVNKPSTVTIFYVIVNPHPFGLQAGVLLFCPTCFIIKCDILLFGIVAWRSGHFPEREVMLMVKWRDLFAFGLFIVALISLVVKLLK